MTPSPILPLLNVLVIDDDEDMRNLICRTLTRSHVASVVEAASGEAAWKFLSMPESQTNFVICDWNMPGISGIDLLRKLKSVKPIMPVLMITGRSDVASIKAAQSAGIDGYLVKPISPKELVLKLSFIVKQVHDRRLAATG